jgi:hypothetical protein
MIQQRLFFSVPLLSLILSMTAAAQSPPSEDMDLDTAASRTAASTSLPPMPARGRSSVIGGEILSVNPVHDQFKLKIFGGKSIQVLYDERTQVYRDGARMSVLDLHPYDHASVETTLDGTKIFALRIHMLSKLPEGDCRGVVSKYDPQTGELTIGADLSHQAITVRVPKGIPVVRVGEDPRNAQQSETFDFAPGLPVEVLFKGGSDGGRVATQVDLLASLGSGYVFTGNLAFVNLRSGQLMVANVRDKRTYEIAFDPARFPVSRELREGTAVRVTTTFDGTRYVANGIEIAQAPSGTDRHF